MAMDVFKNFAYGTIVIPPVPPNLGSSLTVGAGHSNRFPAPPFSASVWPIGLPADPTNAEIIRVTAVAADVWTIVRAQEGSAARAILNTDQVAQALTVKALADLKADILASVTAQNYATQAWVTSQLAPYALKSYVDSQDAAYQTVIQNWTLANFARLGLPRIAVTDVNQQNIYPNVDTTDIVTVNGQVANPLGIQNPTGTAHEGQLLIIRIRDNGTPKTLGWSAAWGSHNAYAALPTATVAWKTLNCAFRFNALYGLWALLAVTQEP